MGRGDKRTTHHIVEVDVDEEEKIYKAKRAMEKELLACKPNEKGNLNFTRQPTNDYAKDFKPQGYKLSRYEGLSPQPTRSNAPPPSPYGLTINPKLTPIMEEYKATQGTRAILWDKMDGTLLGVLGEASLLLEDSALKGVDMRRPHEAFFNPLAYARNTQAFKRHNKKTPKVEMYSACMMVDDEKVRDATHKYMKCGGYLMMLLGGKGRTKFMEGAHRLVLLLTYGPSKEPSYTHVLHICGNKSCINPDHLMWGTQAMNVAWKEPHEHKVCMEEKQGRKFRPLPP